ncbi:MAG TPA: HAMP domain-containing sensor histidine kinase, partial [Acidimicrobiales bacterium]|nr:HAMP domain-containing sensor histidine kinase [Acidimicrobiales bacterium]
VATLVLLAVGVRAPAVDTRARPGPVLAAAAALVAVLAAGLAAVPGVGLALTVDGVGGPAWATAVPASLVAGVWLALACAYVLKGIRLQGLYAWAGALAFALVLAQLADAAAGPAGSRWEVAAAAMRAIGFVVAALGCGLELVRAYADQRARLFDSELTIEADAASDRAEEASRRAQRHDVRNAVVAIEGAAVTLERYRDRLTAGDRASLTQVLTAGVERLQGLLDDGRAPGTVDLAAVAAAVVADMGWAGRVTVDVPAGLAGLGGATQTAEAIRLLLDNADRRAPGGPITVAGRADGTWAVLRVADRGPLVSLQGRRSANARFDAPAAGSGDIGLLVAGRLLRDQGGDLWVDESEVGGAFALCLPLPPAPADGR